MILQTERLIIKPINSSDKDEFIELVSADEIISAIPQEKPTKESIEIKFQRALSFNGNIIENKISILGVFEKEKTALIGIAAFLTNNEGDKELGYRFRQAFWGKGYATEVAKEMINYSFNVLKLDKITADVWVENTASVKVLSKFLKPVKEFFNADDNCTDRRYELLKKDWC